jgi:hypothetical protein
MGNEFIDFGKHKGERWTRVPVSYLRWPINVGSQWAEIAKAELERRGTILEHEIVLTPHAIDRFYLRYAKGGMRRQDIIEMGGIYSALHKIAQEALQQAKGAEEVKYKKFKFVFKYQQLDTILLTVM